jgi:simple sugar transport system permease protein
MKRNVEKPPRFNALIKPDALRGMATMLLQNDRLLITVFKYGTSLVGVMVLSGILIASQGENVGNALAAIWAGAFGNINAFANTLRWTAPCILTGAAAIVAFKAGVVNLGIEGQLCFGALAAALIGAFMSFPPLLHITLCILVAGIVGMLYAVIPAVLRLFFKINEFVTTLMFNFIAVLLTEYIVQTVIRGGLRAGWGFTNANATPTILNTAVLPKIIPDTTATLAFPIAVCIALLIAFLYKYTIQGYELKQVGENLKFARTGGVRVIKTFITIFLLSGFISGLAGGIEIVGTYRKFNVGFSANMGWDGVCIARIAELNPVALIFVSFIWAALRAGSLQMERVTSMNRLTVNIIQMVFVLFVSINYEKIYTDIKNKRRIKREQKEREFKEMEAASHVG